MGGEGGSMICSLWTCVCVCVCVCVCLGVPSEATGEELACRVEFFYFLFGMYDNKTSPIHSDVT